MKTVAPLIATNGINGSAVVVKGNAGAAVLPVKSAGVLGGVYGDAYPYGAAGFVNNGLSVNVPVAAVTKVKNVAPLIATNGLVAATKKAAVLAPSGAAVVASNAVNGIDYIPSAKAGAVKVCVYLNVLI